ncbi:aspartate/glutamate racemase family protein [Ferrovibrio xuzhouensis]|uniref:Aspartate/glutamate racemase family protein n=1 Tax=Ferrovibrio xuzhouensis TaxID=1576914 RepID=A0ABV7VH57_9PROT
MASTIFVINPNSNEAVTAGIDAALEPLRIPGGPEIKSLTLKEGPLGVQTQADVESVTLPLAKLAQTLEAEAGAFVIACFSDPGMHLVRESVKQPVLGIAECGILTALTLGQSFGVIAILDTSIPRHLRLWGAMGMTDRFAGEMAVGLSVAELADRDRTLSRMLETGRRLRDERQAHVLVMGCAGMAAYRDHLEQALGIPVVEPTQAATTMALGRVRLGW